jgi:hypothetical protein
LGYVRAPLGAANLYANATQRQRAVEGNLGGFCVCAAMKNRNGASSVTEHCGRRKQEEHNASEHHYGSIGRSIFHDGRLAFGVIPLPPVRWAKLHWRICSCLDPAVENATAQAGGLPR